jgi:hypothetical protein
MPARFQIADIDESDEMRTAGVKRVPAAALRVLSEAFEIGLAIVLVDEVVFARHVMNIKIGFADGFFRIVKLAGLGFERWVISPVWIMRAGLAGSPLTLPIASFKVPRGSGLAGLLNPI